MRQAGEETREGGDAFLAQQLRVEAEALASQEGAADALRVARANAKALATQGA